MKTTTNDPYAALRYPEFVRLISANSMITAAIMIQEVVIGYELYKLTHDPLSLGFIGLAEALPYISIALFGGHYADRKDKRTIMQISQSVILCCSLALIWVMYPTHRAEYSTTSLLLTVYGILAAIGFAKGFYSPASSSMKAFLTPREVYSNAATWSSTFWQTGAIAGPGIAGFLYAYFGLINTLWVVVGLFAASQLLLAMISKKPIPEIADPQTNVWQSIKEGIKFVYEKKILFYATSLDLAAVLFGGVIAILPVFAEDILKVGAQGLGIMRAAPSVGAVLTIFSTAYFAPTRHAWRNMLIAVAGFGLATLIFAISTNFWLSVLMLFLTGAFDAISVVIRQTILQVVPPDHMRGRVLSVNSVFISSSNEIGAFESGVAAKVFGTVPSVLIGGGLTMVIVTWVWLRSKELFGVKLT
ncbi:MFS transporter [Runella slithyformis]|uniref:Multidrug efflux pump Tap n=1 Tax=Runella slithyformis (strain ATCC 29530 / DSM 19594 / LMG 11500 / NCIMB 11436 / LSU 4) TaxID=761193 RepID=A0A7U3ZKS5_RUNSL|nr:MFS transporter [Runella slithyformis]AEI49013.1 major facilitator superfamily MFS_1 [Runella slithyformis DSM 19594]